MARLADTGRQWLSRRVGFKRALSQAADQALAAARRRGVLDAYPLRVAGYTVRPDHWPAHCPLTLAALADLHFGGSYLDASRLEQVIDRTNDLHADLVVLLGDYGASHLEGEAHRQAMRALATSLQRLDAPLGVIAVLGNHDWWDDPDAQATGRTPIIAAQELRHAGVTVLENEAVPLDHGGRRIWIAGLGDQLAHLGPPTRGVDDLAQLTSLVDDAAPAVLLAHEPDIFPEVPHRYAVTLSGHTHAGQIKVLGRTPIVPSRFGSRYVHGHVVENGRHLIVSAGLGVSTLPLRLGTRPEIVRLTLTS